MGYIVSYMDTALGFDKYMSSNCEKSYMQVSHSYQLIIVDGFADSI